AGTVLAGIIGAVLSVPMVAVAWSVIKVWTDRDVPAQWDPVDRAEEQIEMVGMERKRRQNELKEQHKAEKQAKKARKIAEAREKISAELAFLSPAVPAIQPQRLRPGPHLQPNGC